MRVVVGLGNPERRYAHTRHNLGWRVVDGLVLRLGLAAAPDLRHSLVWEGQSTGHRVLAVKPVTYMNRSGLAVAELTRRFEFDLGTELLVVCDDVNLPLGSCRARKEGSSGGHNGLRSIEESVGSQAFPRLRLGVADAGLGQTPLEDYVLEDFPADCRPAVEELIAYAVEGCATWIAEGIEALIARFNRRTDP